MEYAEFIYLNSELKLLSRNPAPQHNAVQEGVQSQILSPGMQNGKHPCFYPQNLGFIAKPFTTADL